MVFVPDRKPLTEPRFIPAAYSKVEIPVEAYDQGGKALAKMGDTLSSLSKSFARRDLAEEQDKVKQAVTAFDHIMRTSIMGALPSEQSDGSSDQPGFISLQGQDALQSYQPRLHALEQEQARLRASLPTKRAQQMFESSVSAYAQLGRDLMDQHYQQQMRVSSAQTALASSQESQNTGISFLGNADMYAVSLQTGAIEAARAAALTPENGISPEQASADWTSSFHCKVADTLLQTKGVDAADAYVDKHAGTIKVSDRETLEPKLGLARDTQTTQKALAPILDQMQGWEHRMGTPSAPHSPARKGASRSPSQVQAQAQPQSQSQAQSQSGAPSPTLATEPSRSGSQDAPAGSPAEQAPQPIPEGTFSQTAYYGLPKLATMEADFQRQSDKAGLTSQQHALGLASLRGQYAQALDQARQRHGELLDQGFDWISQGNTVETLTPDVTRFLSPRGLDSLHRQQEIQQGQRADEADFPTMLYLGLLPPAAYAKRVLAEDGPYQSPLGRVITRGIHQLVNSTQPLEVHKGESYLSAMARINYASLYGGAAMRQSPVLDSLYLQGLKAVDSLLQDHGAVTDAHLWGAVSPILLDYLDGRVQSGESLMPDRDDIALTTLSRRTSIPPDMVSAVWKDLTSDPKAKPGYREMAQHYHDDPAGIMARTLGVPKDIMAPLVADVRASGQSPSLRAILPLWSAKARTMPASWL